MGIMREIDRLYTPLISRGLYKFKDGFNLADKDERMRKGGKGEMGETSYLLIIPVVFGSWGLGECVCWGLRGRVGWLPCKAQSSYPGPSSAVLPRVDTFPFNYSATLRRIDSPGGSWVNLGLNTHLCRHSYTHTNWLCSHIKSKIIHTVFLKG